MKRFVLVLLAMLAMPAPAAEPGRTYALVSAIGSSLAYTRLKQTDPEARFVYLRLNPSELDNVAAPRGEAVRASSFIAPYFYAQVWVLDARSLEVLYTAERFDYQRIYDPQSAAINIERALPPETLGPLVESFVEKASAKALRDAIGVVTVTEPRVVQPR